MTAWIEQGLAHAHDWLGFQLRVAQGPGLQYAVAHKGEVIANGAFGRVSVVDDTPLTTDHLFRVASHSKTFTAIAILRLCDKGLLALGDPASKHVAGLHPDIGASTIAQLLSHCGGVIRDGTDSNYWLLRRPFLDAAGLRAALTEQPKIDPNTRFKYSNHGYGLLGLIIEAISGQPYAAFVTNEILEPCGLKHTLPDGPVANGLAVVPGHGTRSLTGQRFALATDIATGAMAPATGFAATTADLVRLFAKLPPKAPDDLLSVAARREMTRRLWRVPDSAAEMHYGLGLIHGGSDEWAWYGHSGSFPGTFSHTATVPAHGLTISIAANYAEAMPFALVDGVIAILKAARAGGAPTDATKDWRGRWWSLVGAVDLLAFADKVVVAAPAQANPLIDAQEISGIDGDKGTISKAPGFRHFGETARLERDAQGRVIAFWLAGARLVDEATMLAELKL